MPGKDISPQVSNEKNLPLGWLGYIGDEILPSYIGMISSKQPGIIESKRFFFGGSSVLL